MIRLLSALFSSVSLRPLLLRVEQTPSQSRIVQPNITRPQPLTPHIQTTYPQHLNIGAPPTPTLFCYVLQLKDLQRSVADRYANKGLTRGQIT
jgi:hypothetical protein